MTGTIHLTHVLAAHSYPAFAGGIKNVFNRCDYVARIAVAYCYAAVIKSLREKEYNIIFLDDQLPGMDTHARKAIIRSFPLLKVIMLTHSSDKEYIRRLFAEGASGCMSETALDNEYRLAQKTVTANKKFRCAEITNLLFNEQAVIPPSEESIIQKAKLSKREAEIFPYLIKKIPEKEIAATFFIDYETLKKHRKSIRKKLDAIGMLYILDHLIKPLPGKEKKEILETVKKKKKK